MRGSREPEALRHSARRQGPRDCVVDPTCTKHNAGGHLVTARCTASRSGVVGPTWGRKMGREARDGPAQCSRASCQTPHGLSAGIGASGEERDSAQRTARVADSHGADTPSATLHALPQLADPEIIQPFQDVFAVE
jgi:hypothetical protein